MHKSLIGYARVSSDSQSTDIQLAKLKEAGCQLVRKEKVSGRSRDGRTELRELRNLGMVLRLEVVHGALHFPVMQRFCGRRSAIPGRSWGVRHRGAATSSAPA